MKLFRIVLALVLVCVLVILGAQWLNDPALRRFGQVVVQVGGNDYVATLPKAGLLLLIAGLLVWLLWTLLAAPFRAWMRYRRKQARARLIDGLSALHHGRWLAAEKLLLSAAGEAEVGPVALAAALRAADKRGDEAAAGRHLQRLQEIDPLRHALLQARRLLRREQAEEALALLDNPALQPLPPAARCCASVLWWPWAGPTRLTACSVPCAASRPCRPSNWRRWKPRWPARCWPRPLM